MASPRPTGADPLGAGAGRRRRQGAFLCTDLKPTEILGWFVRRWRVEVTFAEVRRHLGVERHDLAILRTTLLGLFSLVTLWANRIKGGTRCAARPRPLVSQSQSTLQRRPRSRSTRTLDLTDLSPDHRESAKNTDRLINRLIRVACNPP